MRPLLISIGILSWLGTAAVLVAYQPPFEPDHKGYAGNAGSCILRAIASTPILILADHGRS
jgi:hypothetical protein